MRSLEGILWNRWRKVCLLNRIGKGEIYREYANIENMPKVQYNTGGQIHGKNTGGKGTG